MIKLEIQIQNGKFWILENKVDEKNVQRFVYDEVKSAIDRLKELMKTVNTDKLLLSTVDVTDSKGWNITGTPWAVIAMGIVRGDIDEELTKSQHIPETTKKK